MGDLTRRETFGAASLALAAAATPAMAQSVPAPAPPATLAFAGIHQPVPLRYAPSALPGLSERLVQSHWENNYQGSVRALNMIEGRLAVAMADADFPPLVYGGLKREEAHRTGSVILHELYFEGLGGNGVVGGSIAEALRLWFGSVEA